MPSIEMDNGVRADELDAAHAAENCSVKPAPKAATPAPKTKASKTESKLSE
tara:strand:- start:330 stop:482 length:153 start_codon:yes stop_codon:yes gene_type:complete